MCMCVARGGVGGEWATGLGLDFTISGRTWGKWDMCLCFGCGGVVETGLISTSPALMRSIASHPAGPHDRHAPNTVIGFPLLGAGGVDIICTVFFQTAVTGPPRVGCVVWGHCSKVQQQQWKRRSASVGTVSYIRSEH